MRCPKCECVDDKVVDTRVSKEGDFIRRRRECVGCGFRFTTYEMVERVERIIVKKDGRREEFKAAKLRDGMRMACWKRSVSAAQIDAALHNVISKVEQSQEREIPSAMVGKLVMDELKQLDEVAYIRYASVYRRFTAADQFISEVRSMSDNQH
jgi:transcriptional repressor NrdR